MTRPVCTRDCCALDDKASLTALDAAYLKLPRHDSPANGRTHPRCSLTPLPGGRAGRGILANSEARKGGIRWRIGFGSSIVRHEATVGEPPVRWNCCWTSTSSRSVRSHWYRPRADASRFLSTTSWSSRNWLRSDSRKTRNCSSWSVGGSAPDEARRVDGSRQTRER